MNLPRSLRILIAMAILVLGLAALLLLLVIGESALIIRVHLEALPPWLGVLWWGALAALGILLGWLLWRLLRPAPLTHEPGNEEVEPPSEAQIERAMNQAETLGADITTVRQELAELQRRRHSGEIHIVLFGEISTGKSTLVRALLPDARTLSDVRGGTTRTLRRFEWHSPGDDRLTITDMPGTAEADGELDKLAIDEAQRAHIVIYVVDSDLNRRQHQGLLALLQLNKPLILVLNKSDRYSPKEIDQLATRADKLIAEHAQASFVQVSAGTSRHIIRRLPDGSEHEETQNIPPRVDALANALQKLIDGNQALLDNLRDSATFVLVNRHIDAAISDMRREKADKLVDAYAMKAVVGALAAITPGSDLIIQGWLGTQLVKELGELYDTKIGKLDTELLLKLVQQHVGRAHTLLLAIAGNALKAFPGIGTLAGGAIHAVAYGIIFRTLGRALTTTLATRGELHPRQTAKLFEETLGENLETPARNLAKVVVENIGKDGKGSDGRA